MCFRGGCAICLTAAFPCNNCCHANHCMSWDPCGKLWACCRPCIYARTVGCWYGHKLATVQLASSLPALCQSPIQCLHLEMPVKF